MRHFLADQHCSFVPNRVVVFFKRYLLAMNVLTDLRFLAINPISLGVRLECAMFLVMYGD